MMLDERDINKAAQLLAKVEQDIGHILDSHIGDLFADNFNDWSLDKCCAIKLSLQSGHGAGAFYLSHYRNLYPISTHYDAHVLAFRWYQRMWMEREYRHAGERLS